MLSVFQAFTVSISEPGGNQGQFGPGLFVFAPAIDGAREIVWGEAGGIRKTFGESLHEVEGNQYLRKANQGNTPDSLPLPLNKSGSRQRGLPVAEGRMTTFMLDGCGVISRQFPGLQKILHRLPPCVSVPPEWLHAILETPWCFHRRNDPPRPLP